MATPNNLDLNTSERASFQRESDGTTSQQVRVRGSEPTSSSGFAPSTSKDAGTVTKAVVKASSGSVFSFRVTNANAAARYFQLHNKATAPAAAETAQQYFVIPAGTATQPAVVELTSDFFSGQEYFATGIGWAISTTATTFTDSATASDHTVLVRYV
jgi:hypothetical protein